MPEWNQPEQEPSHLQTAQPVEQPVAQVELPPPPPRQRRIRLPLILFLVTCLSTYWAGVAAYYPAYYLIRCLELGSLMPIRRSMISHWQDGLIYMGCVLAILMTHEMGHFLATLRYRIPASLPFFIPFPISPIGTMGAVIAMDGKRANRREIFDIGIAGPLAGLVVAIPIMWIGIQQLDFTQPKYGPFTVDLPLAVKGMLYVTAPEGYQPGMPLWHSHLNPYFMAGWVGFLITGLNMLPVSQLDGGHVTYTLFGRWAHWIARGFVLVALFCMFWFNRWEWTLMLGIVIFIGLDHPPTRDDSVPLGWFRWTLGCLSLSIPVLCFAPGILMPTS